MKPAPELLQLPRYPYQIEISPRFGDMDVLRHLNNVAINRIYEDARYRFQVERLPSLFDRARAWRGFVASVTIEYLREAHYPDPLLIGAAVGQIGRSSYELLLAAFQRGECVGTCSTTLVMVDKQGKPTPIPPEWRPELEAQVLLAAASE